MNRKNFLYLTIFSLLLSINSFSQIPFLEEDTVPNQEVRHAQKYSPNGFDNSSFQVFFYNNLSIYTNNSFPLATGDTIIDIKINPSHNSVASLQKARKGNTYCVIYDIRQGLPEIITKKIKLKDRNVTALAYSPDARQMAVAFNSEGIEIYNTITFGKEDVFYPSFIPSKMEYSSNSLFLVCWNKRDIEIWNKENQSIRLNPQFEYDINDITFSSDSKQMFVLTANGILTIYDTRNFEITEKIENLGQALNICTHRDGKYIAVQTAEDVISIINLYDTNKRQYLTDIVGGISNVGFAYNEENGTELVYNTSSEIVYKKVYGLEPNYGKMLTTELNEQMNLWMKQMPNETLEEYQERVNDVTRVEKLKELELEISTKMASENLTESDITIGSYNTAMKKLALNVNSMQSIYLDVDRNDIEFFNEGSGLEMRNVKYGLTADDNFELVHAEVFNPANGKTYVYNNMERATLAYIEEDVNFVSLDIVKKTNMEETKLESIKEELLEQAKKENLISDKTHISVSANAISDFNVNGERVVNYNVNFTYEVEEEFSMRDDFKAGHYHTEESGAAMSMLAIMNKAFENDFAQYAKEGKQVKIRIKGTADASPIMHRLSYDGKYGEYESEPVYKGKELINISLTKREGITDNDQLAFARAIGVKNYIDNSMPSLGKLKRNYEYEIEVSKNTGSKYRRISVLCTLYDAFK